MERERKYLNYLKKTQLWKGQDGERERDRLPETLTIYTAKRFNPGQKDHNQ